MISTCVHCKKQFEWVPNSSGMVFVFCCHCEKLNVVGPKGEHLYPVIKSQPLQVAKKWVVRQWQGGGYQRWMYLDKNGNWGSPNEFEARKFTVGKDAVAAVAATLLMWEPDNIEKLEYIQVDA